MAERNEFELSVPLIQHENSQGARWRPARVSGPPNIPSSSAKTLRHSMLRGPGGDIVVKSVQYGVRS